MSTVNALWTTTITLLCWWLDETVYLQELVQDKYSKAENVRKLSKCYTFWSESMTNRYNIRLKNSKGRCAIQTICLPYALYHKKNKVSKNTIFMCTKLVIKIPEVLDIVINPPRGIYCAKYWDRLQRKKGEIKKEKLASKRGRNLKIASCSGYEL